jgi:hypothetical protein
MMIGKLPALFQPNLCLGGGDLFRVKTEKPNRPSGTTPTAKPKPAKPAKPANRDRVGDEMDNSEAEVLERIQRQYDLAYDRGITPDWSDDLSR